MKIPPWYYDRYNVISIPMTFYKGDEITLFKTTGEHNVHFEKSASFTRQWQTDPSAKIFELFDRVRKKMVYYVFFDKPIDDYDGFVT